MEMITNVAKLSVELTSPSGPLAMLVEESYQQGMLIQQSALESAAEWIVRLIQENTPEIMIVNDSSKGEFALFHSPVCRIHQGHSCAVMTAMLNGEAQLKPGNYNVWATRPDHEGTELRFEKFE